jgi:hydroxyacylglutathione hydrolase
MVCVLKLISHTGGLASTNCFLVIDETTSKCVLFDAPDHTIEPVLQYIKQEKLELIGLWLTHAHFDHMADHVLVREQFPDAKLLIHELELPLLHNPGSMQFQLPFEIAPAKEDQTIADGDVLSIGNLTCRVIFTPGHAPGHVCFYFEEQKILVGGDLIIGGAIGRTDFPTSDHSKMIESVRLIMKLPDDVVLLPGHGDSTTLGEERQTNPYVRDMIA